jgi:AraC-like DNA-binding protein
MDSLTTLLNQYALRAGVFYAGNLCGVHGFPDDSSRGHLHLVRSGTAQLIGINTTPIVVTEPTVLFLPRPGPHRLVVDQDAGSDMVCGTVQFGVGGWNPITSTLPAAVMVPLQSMPSIEALLQAMFDEAFESRFGRQAILDRYCEIIMLRLLRYCVENGLAQGGAMAGLANPRLSIVLHAVHEAPEQAWTLESMAEHAGMSRARFALLFRQVTGDTPADYVSSWRITSAQRLLRSGRSLKQVVDEVGYTSASAFTRAFTRKVGQPPGTWLKGPHPQPLTTHTEMQAANNET